MSSQKRIWELDAFRGICILGMVVVHFLYDLIQYFPMPQLSQSQLFRFVMQWGGVLFILLSGICANLGHHPIRRGLVVLLGGVICFGVTFAMYKLGFAHRRLVIYYGVLHFLGTCMLLWPVLSLLPTWAMAAAGIVVAATGLYFQTHYLTGNWATVILGLPPRNFATSDYFPLFPYLGFFLLGGALGRVLYPNKATLFPKVNPQHFLIRFLTLCGNYSLLIYLLHQPLITGLMLLGGAL